MWWLEWRRNALSLTHQLLPIDTWDKWRSWPWNHGIALEDGPCTSPGQDSGADSDGVGVGEQAQPEGVKAGELTLPLTHCFKK